jgi:hypothetical protein
VKFSYEEFVQGSLSYEDFVRAHSLAPLVDVKTACRIANVGHSRFYELVKDGVFVLIPNGARRNVSALNLHQYYSSLIVAARLSQPAERLASLQARPEIKSPAMKKTAGAV